MGTPYWQGRSGNRSRISLICWTTRSQIIQRVGSGPPLIFRFARALRAKPLYTIKNQVMKFVSDFSNPKRLLVLGAIIFSLTACADDTEGHPGGNDDIDNVNGTGSLKEHEAIFIYIDEDSIDNGNERSEERRVGK